MNTSNYSRNGTHPNAVAISAKPPTWYKGRAFTQLAPSWSIFNEYKEGGDEEIYTGRFYSEILSELVPEDVYEALGEDAILLCYESPGDFCHRRIVAEWLEKALGIEIKEIE